MALDYKFDIKLAVENALYEHTTDDMGLKEIEEIRGLSIRLLMILLKRTILNSSN